MSSFSKALCGFAITGAAVTRSMAPAFSRRGPIARLSSIEVEDVDAQYRG